jgi:hypothetical protein
LGLFASSAEIGSSVGGLFVAIALCLMTPSAANAETVDLTILLANSGFEDDFVHPSGTATKKSKNYLLSAPFVNPITAWAPNGEWASQIFQFQINTELRYVSLAITRKNHKSASYAAFDVLE